ncbi:hypothetical protein [Erythrobacter sp. YT30]|uniref:hypothetical protein n=1 Tax=Erythrobacter sp. YT30 TaxID=1735012 RepID=UPI00076D9112|nr:hypothetical protein [Erythrobacter sp. YT30]KWV90714.1 hypothetical protein AUC45_04980 [Erythrobacter sp. YT30]
MRFSSISAAFALLAVSSVSPLSASQAETYESYLSRLKDICEVECLQPRDFQRKARKQGSKNKVDMAIIMDVAYVTREGPIYQLHNLDRENSYFDDLQLLGSAGINTSSRNGIGGLPRGRSNPVHPDLIIIEMDEATVRELLGLQPVAGSETETGKVRIGSRKSDGIIVEGETTKDGKKVSQIDFRSLMRGRRVVVRGKPRLQAVWLGARLDQRRKQVTLELSDADDLVLLPRYDDDGKPLKEDLAWLASKGGANGE